MHSMLLLLLACQPAPCPDGQLRQDGDCVDYVPSDPVEGLEVWEPAPKTSWQWQLTEAVDLSYDVEMYDIDLFDASDLALATLRQQGRAVICYFSAGSYEDWREDAADFPAAALGDKLDGWPGERWIDVGDPTVREIMAARLDLAVARGCDGVEPDNVDGYANDNGLGLNATDQLDYNRWLADEAHSRGLSVGLKNDLDQIPDLLDWFDWALNEECVAYDECALLAPFTEAGKAAFHVEYVDDWSEAEALAAEVCGQGPSLDTLIKTWDLDASRLGCDD